LEQILESILTIGRVTGRTEKAEQLVSALRSRIEMVEELVAKARSTPEVACLEWLDPIFSAGHWVPEMVARAGGVDRLARASMPSVQIEWKRVLDYNPEILIMMPCGFDLEKTIQESRTLKARSGWENLRAVRNHRVFAVNGTAYFNRPGPRIVDGLEILAEILHPDVVTRIAPANSYSRLSL
jgi:iron complex transport system substrate-binding protein